MEPILRISAEQLQCRALWMSEMWSSKAGFLTAVRGSRSIKGRVEHREFKVYKSDRGGIASPVRLSGMCEFTVWHCLLIPENILEVTHFITCPVAIDSLAAHTTRASLINVQLTLIPHQFIKPAMPFSPNHKHKCPAKAKFT